MRCSALNVLVVLQGGGGWGGGQKVDLFPISKEASLRMNSMNERLRRSRLLIANCWSIMAHVAQKCCWGVMGAPRNTWTHLPQELF